VDQQAFVGLSPTEKREPCGQLDAAHTAFANGSKVITLPPV